MSDQDDEKALMDAAIELMRGLGETPTPKLDAATLPIGTVMVLSGDFYEKRSDGDRGYSWVRHAIRKI
jgi:hypothetical protein